jgi:hypothetical protein
MNGPLLGLLVLAMGDAAILYACVIARRAHDRRIQARIHETRHLEATLRAGLALQRGTA